MLAFCGSDCARAYVDSATRALQIDGPQDPGCAQCGSLLEPPPWSPDSRALLVELSRLVRGGRMLERALRTLDRESVLALRQVVRDLEWERASLRNKAARLGLRGLH